MCCVMRKPCELKVICYAACLVDLNDYFYALPVAKTRDNIGEINPNEIILSGMPNLWSKQAYVQGFMENYYLKNS